MGHQSHLRQLMVAHDRHERSLEQNPELGESGRRETALVGQRHNTFVRVEQRSGHTVVALFPEHRRLLVVGHLDDGVVGGRGLLELGELGR